MHKKLAAEAEASAELAALEEEKVFADFKATICDEGYGQQRGRPNVPPPAALPPPPGGAPNYAGIHIWCQGHFPHVYLKNFFTTQNIWIWHHNLPVKSPRT